jgi:hypothetical protein
MKRLIPITLAILLMSIFISASLAQINQAAAAHLRAERTSKHSPQKTVRHKRFKRERGALGFVRLMPNKLIRHGNQAFLVNNRKQRVPVTISDKAPQPGAMPHEGFYLGYFYDLETRQTRYAYLSTR